MGDVITAARHAAPLLACQFCVSVFFSFLGVQFCVSKSFAVAGAPDGSQYQ